MSFVSIVGLACVNQRFRELLFREGARGARDSGLPFLLSQEEIDKLDQFVNSAELREAFNMLNVLLCQRPPCPNYPLPIHIGGSEARADRELHLSHQKTVPRS